MLYKKGYIVDETKFFGWNERNREKDREREGEKNYERGKRG